MAKPTIYTIGHSNHSIDQFLGLLRQHGVTAIADIRSVPKSRFRPHFNREKLCDALVSKKYSMYFLEKN